MTRTSHQGRFSHAVNVGNKVDHGQSSRSDAEHTAEKPGSGRANVLNVLLRS